MKAAKLCNEGEACGCGRRADAPCRLREAHRFLHLAKKEVGDSFHFRSFCRAANIRFAFWIDEERPRLKRMVIRDVLDLAAKIATAANHRFAAHRKADIAVCLRAIEPLRERFIADRQPKRRRGGGK